MNKKLTLNYRNIIEDQLPKKKSYRGIGRILEIPIIVIPVLNPNACGQRGSSENINRMVRCFFPKKTHSNTVSKQAL